MHKEQVLLGLLSESGNTGTWSYCPATQLVEVDANTRNLMRSSDALSTTLTGLLACVQADDRAGLEQDMHAAIANRGAFVRTFQLEGMGESSQLTMRARWSALPETNEGVLFGLVERSLLSTLQSQAIQRRFEQLRNALDGSPVILYEQDAQLRYEWVLAPRVGLNPEDIVGRMASDFLEAQSAQEIDDVKRRVIESGNPIRRRLLVQSKSKEGGYFDVYMAPRHGSDGNVDGVISVAIDMAETSAQEQRLLAIFERAPVGIVLSRRSDSVIVNANQHFLEIFGYSREETIGATVVQLQSWLQPEQRARMFSELEKNGFVRNMVAGFRHRSGRAGRVLISTEYLEIAGEQILLGMISDVTELEDARQALVRSEARYKLLSDASFEGVGLARDGIVVDANEQIARILGVTREELIGKAVTRNMKRADVPRALQTLRNGGDSNSEYEYLRPDGSKVIVEVRSKDLVQQGGDVLRISALRDVTEKRQREQELQYLQIRFARMMDSNMVGVYVARPSGEILESNDYFLNLIGRSRTDLDKGLLNWKDLTPQGSMQVSLDGRNELLRSGVCKPYEKEYWRPGGFTVHVLVALAHLPAPDYQILAIVVDISALKAAQAELQQVNAQLVERTQVAERAEAAKTLFLSSISHELRTPLHTMLGHVRLMRKRASGENLKQLSVVERSSTHLLRLIEELLEYNHTAVAPERLEPDVVMLDGFLNSLQLIADAVTADSDNQFFMQMSDDLPTAMVVDEVRLTQVLRILIDNACKYTRDGALIFSLSCEGGRRVVDGAERCSLRFSIEDNGRGIEESDVGRIFEPLYRGTNAADLHGLGLGLAIATRWIERMGSTIQVESSRGLGSQFSFVLDLPVSFGPVSPAREMLRNSALSPQSAQITLPLQPMPQEDLHMFGELINMGRLGRLRDWAQALEKRFPQHRYATALVSELAANADLEGLQKFHARWAALGSVDEPN